MELTLTRELADKRYYPAVDLLSSGTRREELLFDQGIVRAIAKLRSVLAPLDCIKRYQLLNKLLDETEDNAELLIRILQKTSQL